MGVSTVGPIREPIPLAAAAIAVGGMRTASAEELRLPWEALVAAWIPNGPKAGTNVEVRSRRFVSRILDTLLAQPGSDWQQRWEHWVAQGEPDWRPPSGSSGAGIRWESTYATSALIVLEAVRPTADWLLGQRRKRLWTDWAAYHDPELYRAVITEAKSKGGHSPAAKVVSSLVIMSIVTGKSLPQLTMADFRTLRAAHHQRGVGYHRLPTCWTVAKAVGLFAAEPDSYAELGAAPKMTPAQLVDRHGVHDAGVRQIFIDYLTEVSVTCDYRTLYALELILVKNFWGDVQAHHPGIDTLHLSAEQAAGWRTRLMVYPDGRPRRGWAAIMDRVRTFYGDISAWAMEDPARWAARVAPNPVPRRVIKGARQKETRRQQNHLKSRTRTLAPWVPQLVRSVTEELTLVERLMAAALATPLAHDFDLDGQRWHRRGHNPNSREYLLTNVQVNDPAGQKFDLTLREHRAFWTWAALEVLRHTGLRVEEMLELTHLSVRPLRKPNGEVVPLLQVAPSKTDEERILPMSPPLAHALSRIINRHNAAHGKIPLIQRFDAGERVFSSPLPFLFQHSFASGTSQVLSDASVRKYLAAAGSRAGLRDADGTLLRPTPHDFRRLYLTELIANKLPIHIAARLAGHRSLTTTQGYVAIYPQDVFDSYDVFLHKRRAQRPGEEYREPTPEELKVFADHFGRRRVELGDCVRPYDSGCVHEHACIRCQFLTVHPGAKKRLDSIADDLNDRITTATTHTWLADVEQLRITMTRLNQKRTGLEDLDATASDFDALMGVHPIAELPDSVEALNPLGHQETS